MNLQKLSPWNWFKREEREAPRSGELMPAGRDRSHPLTHMHREMDRLFEDFLGMPRWPDPDTDLMLKPSVDIAESKKAYRVSVEVPGVDEKDIDVTVQGDSLIISGEKKQESEDDDDGFHRVERRYGSFRRILSLPTDTDADGIKARFKNGVLKITIPRTAEKTAESRRIQIGG